MTSNCNLVPVPHNFAAFAAQGVNIPNSPQLVGFGLVRILPGPTQVVFSASLILPASFELSLTGGGDRRAWEAGAPPGQGDPPVAAGLPGGGGGGGPPRAAGGAAGGAGGPRDALHAGPEMPILLSPPLPWDVWCSNPRSAMTMAMTMNLSPKSTPSVSSGLALLRLQQTAAMCRGGVYRHCNGLHVMNHQPLESKPWDTAIKPPAVLLLCVWASKHWMTSSQLSNLACGPPNREIKFAHPY